MKTEFSSTLLRAFWIFKMTDLTPLKINIVTIFPEFFRDPLTTSIIGRAAQNALVDYRVVDLRDFTSDSHRTVDDTPYGGGSGMVMKPEPFFEAVDSLNTTGPIILLSARGKVFDHSDAVYYSMQPELTLLCGHYKDVDQRVADHLATKEISVGRFVLSGGEIGALVITDAIVRLIPGAIGDHESASGDSFYNDGQLSAPSYTRPPEYRGYQVPEVLRTGDHAKIASWRDAEAARLSDKRKNY